MSAGPNRHGRRALRGRAAALAPLLAATCLDYARDGTTAMVTDRAATAALGKAFLHMMAVEACRPHVTRLSMAEAAGFPHSNPTDSRAVPWLAVGFDRAGHATYCLRWLVNPGAGLLADRRLIEMQMLAELAGECATPGFPAGINSTQTREVKGHGRS